MYVTEYEHTVLSICFVLLGHTGFSCFNNFFLSFWHSKLCSSMNKCGGFCCSFLLLFVHSNVSPISNSSSSTIDSIAHVFLMMSTSVEMSPGSIMESPPITSLKWSSQHSQPRNVTSLASLKNAWLVAIMDALCLNGTQYHGNP